MLSHVVLQPEDQQPLVLRIIALYQDTMEEPADGHGGWCTLAAVLS
jgi:hypothetical protein